MNNYQKALVRTYKSGAYKQLSTIADEGQLIKAIADTEDYFFQNLIDDLGTANSEDEAIAFIKQASRSSDPFAQPPLGMH